MPFNSNSFILILITAVVTGIVSHFFQQRRTEQQFRSLIIIIAKEMLLAFERCVLYDQQAKEGTVSFSGIFTFTDSSSIAQFASTVTEDEEVIEATMNLKNKYFQVSRHVEKASSLALESRRLKALADNSDDPDSQNLLEQASKLHFEAQIIQGTALAFFKGVGHQGVEFEQFLLVEKDLEIIIKAAQKICPTHISLRFDEDFKRERIRFRTNNNMPIS